MPNIRPGFRAFTMIDNQGNKVPGTTVLRKVKPKNGRWIEDSPVNICCDVDILTYEPSDAIGLTYSFLFKCDATTVLSHNIATAAVSIDALVVLLNSQLGWLGVFSLNNGSTTTITLRVDKAVGNDLCPEGVFSFSVEATS